MRVIIGGEVIAARGRLPLGTADAGVVGEARTRDVASAIVTVDGQPVQVAAARMPAAEGAERRTAPVLVLASPVVAEAAAAVRVPELADHALHFALAGGIGLAGFGLLLAGGRRRRPAEITGEILHETTAKMGSLGTPDNPPPIAVPHLSVPPHVPPVGHAPTMVLQPPTGHVPPPGHAPTMVHAALPVHAPASPTPKGWMTDGAPVQVARVPTGPAISPTVVAVPATPPPPARRPPAVNPTAMFAVPAQPSQPPPGTKPFGRYRLRDRIGEGGMSEIFLADAMGAEGFKRTFVLKRLRPDLARDDAAVAQFVDEARLQASLIHPNIVPVLDFGVIDGEYFMTEEYVAGRDLAKLMARYQGSGGAPLPTPAAYYVAHETLQALAFAHEMTDRNGAPLGIVHRDVSLGNVLVSLQGEVKLIDFGIVMANDRVTKTQVGIVKGNANFMSPEQARGAVVDCRSDLFSLGLVLYYALTGRMLYGAGSDLGVLYQASNGPTPADYAQIRSLPEPSGAILEKALAFDPRERFQSAAEFADALATHSGGGKTIAAKLMQRLFSEEIRHEQA